MSIATAEPNPVVGLSSNNLAFSIVSLQLVNSNNRLTEQERMARRVTLEHVELRNEVILDIHTNDNHHQRSQELSGQWSTQGLEDQDNWL